MVCFRRFTLKGEDTWRKVRGSRCAPTDGDARCGSKPPVVLVRVDRLSVRLRLFLRLNAHPPAHGTCAGDWRSASGKAVPPRSPASGSPPGPYSTDEFSTGDPCGTWPWHGLNNCAGSGQSVPSRTSLRTLAAKSRCHETERKKKGDRLPVTSPFLKRQFLRAYDGTL